MNYTPANRHTKLLLKEAWSYELYFSKQAYQTVIEGSMVL